MKKLVATLFIVAVFTSTAFAQAPTLTIVTETPGLPSDLFYGSVRVKPLRLRPGTNTPITIADKDFFVQQQYIDFLRRFPEAAGLQFYIDILSGCAPSDAECIRYTRGAVSANFFRSPEFRTKGAYILYLYMVAIGQRPITAAELPAKNTPNVNDRPHYAEFMTDMAAITSPDDRNGPDPAKKQALTVAFLQRPQLVALYPGSMTNAQFAQALVNNAGVTLTPATQNAVNAATTKPDILRIIADSDEVNTKFFKPAFVTMEYFGYLRRDPEDCHDPANYFGTGDPNACGFIFHNNRFNLSDNADLIQNIIVRGFIESPEYINRF